jgi:repressor of nif and glnA expression
MSDYENQNVRPDARLIILKALVAQTDERLHSGFIAEELRAFGIDRPREWIHGELDWLSEMGAVTLAKPGSVVVATLTEKGARHLRRAIVIEGIKRPSRPGE